MKATLTVTFTLCCAAAMQAAVGASKLCPIPGRDIASLRKIVSAEAIEQSDPLREAWEFLDEYSSKPQEEISPIRTGRFGRFKAYLENQKKPEWYTRSPIGETLFARAIGDDVFVRQRESTETQDIKALAILYIADAKAGSSVGNTLAEDVIARLLRRTPWDWEIRAIYSRLLLSVGKQSDAWFQARMAAYLSPSPQLWQLQQLESLAEKIMPSDWDEVEKMMDDVADDPVVRAVMKSSVAGKRQSQGKK